MKIVTTISCNSRARNEARRVLVPTMGALARRAYLELIRVAREQAGAEGEVAVSIFVNPLQFEPGSDFSRYPRPETADEEICRDAGVDLLFRPLPNEMYLRRSLHVRGGNALSEQLCGARGRDIFAASARW